MSLETRDRVRVLFKENARLREQNAAMLAACEAIVVDYDNRDSFGRCMCIWCENTAEDHSQIHHEADCPVRLAQAAIAKAKEGDNDSGPSVPRVVRAFD